jgi:formylglycine-generating enzyme required for sulfatase activity
VDGIPPGVNWKRYLRESVESCALLLVVIGKDWLDMRDAGTGERRLEQAVDFVRFEIETALQRGIPIIPLFLNGLNGLPAHRLPSSIIELADYEGMQVRRLPDFTTDMERLHRAIDRFLAASPIARPSVAVSSPTPPLAPATSPIPLLEWIDIPAGDFLMGSDKKRDNQACDDETPQHTATTTAYKIGKYPVTYAQYALFVANGGYAERTFWTDAGWDRKGDKTQPEVGWNDPDWHKDDHPVIGVTWYESAAFCNWLTAWLYPAVWENHLRTRANRALHTVPGLIRLPTEAEWEKAARWDEKRKIALIYPYGDTYDPKKANTSDSGIGHTTAVTTYPNGISPYGVFDMSGTVTEWYLTKWRISYKDNADEAASGANTRIVRGLSWYSDSLVTRAAYCLFRSPGGRFDVQGFRLCALS